MISASYFIVRTIVGPIIKLLWIKKVTGRTNIPSGGSALIALNHQSYFDFFCFISISKRNIYFLSAEKFFTNKFWLPLMLMTGQIRVNREGKDKSKTHALVFQKLKEGKLVGIFPEGTRAPDSKEMLPAFIGVAKYALNAEVDIIPVGIIGAFDVMSRFDKRPKFGKKIQIKIGEPIKIENYKNRKRNEETYREITETVMKKIAILSEKKLPQTLIR
jgi:1-acyl-sn-glycerol-3-phosphate acyltransferase